MEWASAEMPLSIDGCYRNGLTVQVFERVFVTGSHHIGLANVFRSVDSHAMRHSCGRCVKSPAR